MYHGLPHCKLGMTSCNGSFIAFVVVCLFFHENMFTKLLCIWLWILKAASKTLNRIKLRQKLFSDHVRSPFSFKKQIWRVYPSTFGTAISSWINTLELKAMRFKWLKNHVTFQSKLMTHLKKGFLNKWNLSVKMNNHYRNELEMYVSFIKVSFKLKPFIYLFSIYLTLTN